MQEPVLATPASVVVTPATCISGWLPFTTMQALLLAVLQCRWVFCLEYQSDYALAIPYLLPPGASLGCLLLFWWRACHSLPSVERRRVQDWPVYSGWKG
jgi:hypothetical protein